MDVGALVRRMSFDNVAALQRDLQYAITWHGIGAHHAHEAYSSMPVNHTIKKRLRCAYESHDRRVSEIAASDIFSALKSEASRRLHIDVGDGIFWWGATPEQAEEISLNIHTIRQAAYPIWRCQAPPREAVRRAKQVIHVHYCLGTTFVKGDADENFLALQGY